MSQRQFLTSDTDNWADRFGYGSDGSLVVAGNTTLSYANAGCSGTAGTTSLTLDAASTFANGELVLIHQSRGGSVGSWELNKIASGGGGTSLTMAYNLINTYTDSGAAQAQIVEFKQYTDITINSSVALGVPGWTGNQGGIMALMCAGLTTVTGSLSVAGITGIKQTYGTNGNGGGYHGGGGFAKDTSGGPGIQGEGEAGAGGQSKSSNGEGGGAAQSTSQHGVAAQLDSTLKTLFIFGGGGGGGASDRGTGPTGGNGGGIIILLTKSLTVTGAITTAGGNGYANGSNDWGDGGGGAGGCILIKTQVANIGTGPNVLADGGLAGTGGNGGKGAGGGGAIDGLNGDAGAPAGNAGYGTIHIDYSQSLTGTSSPTLSSTQDLIFTDPPQETGYGFFM